MKLLFPLMAALLLAPVVVAGAGPRTETHHFFGKPPLSSYCDETLAPDALNSGAACFYLRGSHTYSVTATRDSGLAGPGPVYARYVVFGNSIIWKSGDFCGDVRIEQGGLKLGVFLKDNAPASCGGMPQTADVGRITVVFED